MATGFITLAGIIVGNSIVLCVPLAPALARNAKDAEQRREER
jgi:hypothetical protein